MGNVGVMVGSPCLCSRYAVQDLFMRLTLDGICTVGFGVEIGTLSPSLPAVPFATNFDNANEAVTYRFFDPIWPLKQRLNIGNEAVLARSVKVVDDFTYKVIQTRRTELQYISSQGKEMVGTWETKPVSYYNWIWKPPDNHMIDI